jgi:hypothetical protein
MMKRMDGDTPLLKTLVIKHNFGQGQPSIIAYTTLHALRPTQPYYTSRNLPYFGNPVP